ncbi:MAG TPA: MgtC/SapB family protein [Sedimentisphaerales bacterium]|nr:MgtC/SapB family protein [Sedimentisphaerales bacterium]
MISLAEVYAVVLAVVFGAAIGAEREFNGKAAGLRTNVLICVGAAVFTIISGKMAAGHADSLTRIAAQVVTGVGFLGAGAIIQDRGGVHGLTTAATIWVVSSIGMACGAHFYLLALVSCVMTIGVLLGLGELTMSLQRGKKKRRPPEPGDQQI